jgi:putative ABC transport system permease protein
MVPLLPLLLAWSNLAHHRGRFVASTAGVGFAVFLMFMELGFLQALFDGQLTWMRKLNADLVITSKAWWASAFSEPFPRGRLAQARAAAGVRAAYPLYVQTEATLWRNPVDRTQLPIRVLAFNPEDPVFLLPEVCRQTAALKQANTVLLDQKSRGYYGPLEAGVSTELAGRKTRVVGTFRLGPDFLSDGNVIMSDRTYAEYFALEKDPDGALSRVDVGLLRLQDGADPRAVAAQLRQALPEDVTVLTKAEFLEHELAYWRQITPFGYIFGLGVALGFVVGVIICYQVLYTEVSDRQAQFATLKAIGYSDREVLAVVLTQSLILASLGFASGTLVSLALYAGVAATSGLPMHLDAQRALLVLALTVGMCLVSGMLAVRLVLRADPAEVFG